MSTPCLPQLRSSSSMHSRQPSPGISTYFQFKFPRQFPTDSSPYSALCSPNFTTLTTNTSHTREKYFRSPSYLCIGTIHNSVPGITWHPPLFLVPHDAQPHDRRYVAPPHLTGNVPGERKELLQLSSSHQATARPKAMRRSRGKDNPGVWFGSWVCILARE